MTHVWVPADKLIRWEHCSTCLVIKRKDGKNTLECKGHSQMRNPNAFRL